MANKDQLTVEQQEKIKELKKRYSKFLFIVKTFNGLKNPSYALVSKETGIPYSSVVHDLNDYSKYEVVYGYKAPKIYNYIQDKIKAMKKQQAEVKEEKTVVKQPADKKSFQSKVIDEANFFLQNNYSLDETALKLGITKETLQNHFQKLYFMNADLYYSVRQKQEELLQVEEEKNINNLKEEARDYLKNSYTDAEYALKLNIGKESLLGHFKKLQEKDPELFELIKLKHDNQILAKKQDFIEQIKEDANYYLEHDYTVAEIAKEKGINKSTLGRRFKKLQEIDPELYTLVRQRQEINLRTYSKEEINKLADIFITSNYSLRELSESSGISITTLYRLFKSDYLDEKKRAQIEAVFKANFHHTTVDEMEKKTI